MSTAQITPISVFLGPGVQVYSGANHATPEAYKLVSDQGNPGWLALLRPWDLVVDTEASPDTSAHILSVESNTKARLDKDIMTVGEHDFQIIRPARRRLMPPTGADYTFYSFLCNFPYATDIVGVEVFSYNGLVDRTTYLYRTDSSGILNNQGRSHQCTRIESIIVANYVTGANVIVRVEGEDSTIPNALWTPS